MMKDEIKEILDWLKDYKIDKPFGMSIYDRKILSDYITNLQEELEDLREDNYAYHQLMKMQNKREYRSKFLKEFQEEFGTNTFPDYDEIYKRYDKIKKENKKLEERIEYLDRSNNRREDEIMSLRDENVDLASENEKLKDEIYSTNQVVNEEIIKLKSRNKLLSAENSYYKYIINEIKNMCKEEYYKKNTNDIDSIGLSNNIWVIIYMKLKELKENNK